MKGFVRFKFWLSKPVVRHAVGAQGVQLRPTQLHGMEAKHIGQQVVGLLLLPQQQAIGRRLPQSGQPLRC